MFGKFLRHITNGYTKMNHVLTDGLRLNKNITNCEEICII